MQLHRRIRGTKLKTHVERSNFTKIGSDLTFLSFPSQLSQVTLGKSAQSRRNFLDKSSHLYKRVCPSVHRSVRRSVRYASSFSAISACLLAPRGQYWLLFRQLVINKVFWILYISHAFGKSNHTFLHFDHLILPLVKFHAVEKSSS